MVSTDPTFESAIKYLPTTEAYDRWAKVYDTDGNFLQAIDNLEMKNLLPRLTSSLQSPKPWRLVDLGCGTGRNTALLMAIDNAEITALDASSGMLAVARSRLESLEHSVADPSSSTSSQLRAPSIHFGIFDLITSTSLPAHARNADAIISTLVLEHIPLNVFFSHVSKMLKPGGVLLLTNMHSHMGGISQAGFVDASTGEKIRPTSYAHTVADTVAEAEKWGLFTESEESIKEVTVEEHMVEALGPRSVKWVGVTCWFGGLFRKTSSLGSRITATVS